MAIARPIWNIKTLRDFLNDIKLHTGTTSVEIKSQFTNKTWEFPIDEVPIEFMAKPVVGFAPKLWGLHNGEHTPIAYQVILYGVDDFCSEGEEAL